MERNLARVLGPGATPEHLRRVSKQAMRNYLRYWCDTFRLETWSQDRVDATFPLDGQDILDKEFAAGKGVVLALPHMGNWDHAGAWAANHFGGFTTVAERLKPERLFERFLAYRESIGMEVLPLTGGQNTFLGLVRRTKAVVAAQMEKAMKGAYAVCAEAAPGIPDLERALRPLAPVLSAEKHKGEDLSGRSFSNRDLSRAIHLYESRRFDPLEQFSDMDVGVALRSRHLSIDCQPPLVAPQRLRLFDRSGP